MRIRINMYGFIIILFIVLIALKMYTDSDDFNLRCIVSTVDGKKYCVRERNQIQKASNLLATTTEKLGYLVENVGQRYPERENVKKLVKNFNPTTVKETLPTSEFTAYSENKGEKLAFCLNKKKHNNDNLNTVAVLLVPLLFIVLVLMSKNGIKFCTILREDF